MSCRYNCTKFSRVMKKIVGMNILNIGRGYFANIVVKLLPVLTDECTMYHNKSVCVYMQIRKLFCTYNM